jgi:hypothetical protein
MDTTSLATTAQARMEHARPAAHGRSAQTVHGGHDRALRQTVVALRAGTTLHEHHSTRDVPYRLLTLLQPANPARTASDAARVTWDRPCRSHETAP